MFTSRGALLLLGVNSKKTWLIQDGTLLNVHAVARWQQSTWDGCEGLRSENLKSECILAGISAVHRSLASTVCLASGPNETDTPLFSSHLPDITIHTNIR